MILRAGRKKDGSEYRIEFINKDGIKMAKQLMVSFEGTPCYEISIEPSFDNLAKKLCILSAKHRRVCIVTDSNVKEYYLNEIDTLCRDVFSEITSFVFPAGEAFKNMDTVQKLYLHLIEQHFDRNDLLIALGGGVVGDLTGFAAATYLRGIDFIQIPTTLLSQVDSSIGGKTGVDFMQYKNMVGAFHMPKLVYMNLSTLCTLPEEQFSSGMAEIIKHGLIRSISYYRWLKENREGILSMNLSLLEEMIFQSCQIKKQVVEEDPKEQGIRAYLNFGHTIGHAVEKLSDFSLGHGQCVALGMVCAIYLSQKLGNISPSESEDILQTLQSYRLPIYLPIRENTSEILKATKSDKKMSGTNIKFIVLKNMGEAEIFRDFSDSDLLDGISQIQKGAR